MFAGTGDDRNSSFHRCHSLLLVILSIALFPFSLSITTAAVILRSLGIVRNATKHDAAQLITSKRVLITGVSMEKGLFLARTMYLGGCTVYAADFDHHLNLQCGRFSRAVHKFITLSNPSQHGVDAYISQVVNVIRHESIDLWISCSGVATAIEDAQLARAVEDSTSCKAFQLNEQAVSLLDDKMNFMKMTTELGLSGLKWHSLTSTADAKKLIQQLQSAPEAQNTKYIVKSASMDDTTRGALPILQSNALGEMQRVLSGLIYTNGKAWILQEYVDGGEEYCTQAVIVNNQVIAFTACRSESVLMHYTQLNQNSILFKQMLAFTQDYAEGLSKKTGSLTGHISFDFLVRYQETKGGFTGILAPIECNPRCHTATVLFRGLQEDLANCYLSSLQQKPTHVARLIGNPLQQPGFFWTAHDLVTLVVLPILRVLSRPSTWLVAESFRKRAECLVHLTSWKDPTFEWWDPVPWLVLNHMYWPLELLLAAYQGTRWKELNVSTTKMFKC